MKLRNIFAALAAAAAAACTMSAAALAEELKHTDLTEYSGEIPLEYEYGVYDIFSEEGDAPAFAPEDTVLLYVMPFVYAGEPFDAGLYEEWSLSILGFDAEGNGGRGFSNEGIFGSDGTIYVAASVQDIADANGFADGELYSIRFTLEGPSDDDFYFIGAAIGSEQAFGDTADYFDTITDGAGAMGLDWCKVRAEGAVEIRGEDGVTWENVIADGDVAAPDDAIYVYIEPLAPNIDTSDWYIVIEAYDADGNGGELTLYGDGGQPEGCVYIYELLEQSGLELEELYCIDIYVFGPEYDENYILYSASIYDVQGEEDAVSVGGKDNADTGAEGAAAAAGVALIAAGAAVIFGKRR